jgi:hypothetical protein
MVSLLRETPCELRETPCPLDCFVTVATNMRIVAVAEHMPAARFRGGF